MVAEFAERGAEDGAGASLSVTEPWEGYARMKAQEVVQRIGGASREELAVVELFEGTHRRRQKVIAAAEQRLKELSPAASRTR